MHEVVCGEELADKGMGDIIANLGGYNLRGWNSGSLSTQGHGKIFHKVIVESLEPSNLTSLKRLLIAFDAWAV